MIKIQKLFIITFYKYFNMLQKTTAHRRYTDDVESHIKIDRMNRMIALYRKEVEKLNRAQIGQHQLVLVEGVSIFPSLLHTYYRKKSNFFLFFRSAFLFVCKHINFMFHRDVHYILLIYLSIGKY